MSYVPFMDLPAQNAPLRDDLLAVLDEALKTGGFVGGHMVSDFESELADFVGARHAVAVGSGTDALRFALIAMGARAGLSVITVPNSFIATTEAISQSGASIEFVDVDPETSLLDAEVLRTFLNRRMSDAGTGRSAAPQPAVIVPVHLYGQCADMDPIREIAKSYGLKVLEDAAQALGATYKGRPACSFGDAAAISFYPGKNLGACGEAGAIVTDDPEIAATARMLRDHGQQTKYLHQLEGYNGRMDAIQAGFLSVKLPYLNAWNKKRRILADRYDKAFRGSKAITPVTIDRHNSSTRHLYVVHLDDRDGAAKHLSDAGIATGLHYPVPLHLQACYKSLGYEKGSFPVAEGLAERLLSLPIYPELTADDVDAVAEALISFVGEGS